MVAPSLPRIQPNAGALKPVELCTTAEALLSASERADAALAAAASSLRLTAPARPPSVLIQTTDGAPAPAAFTSTSTHPDESAPVAVETQPSSTRAATEQDAATTPVSTPTVDPGQHLDTLFTAATLRSHELRPQHLARLLGVMRRRQQQQQRRQRWQLGSGGAGDGTSLLGDVEGCRTEEVAVTVAGIRPVLAGFLAEVRGLQGSRGSGPGRISLSADYR